jgi:hypothetical protein
MEEDEFDEEIDFKDPELIVKNETIQNPEIKQ